MCFSEKENEQRVSKNKKQIFFSQTSKLSFLGRFLVCLRLRLFCVPTLGVDNNVHTFSLLLSSLEMKKTLITTITVFFFSFFFL